MDSLVDAYNRAASKHQREHVTPYFYENSSPEELHYKLPGTPYNIALTPDGYRIALLHHTPDFGYLRWTVDTPEDFELIQEIVSNLPDSTFNWKDVLALVQKDTHLMQINAQVKHKSHLDIDSRIS
jgi:spore coat polysaccharide biosynthesis protein SpsF